MAIGTGVYKVSGRGEIFVLENNKWRYVCTEAVLFQAAYSWADVQTIPIEEWCPYEVGYPMPGGWADPNDYGYYPHSSWYIEACAVTPPPVYTCPQCEATFGSQGELDTHIAEVHPSPPPPPNGDWTAQQIQIPIIAWGGGFETLRQTGCNIVYISHPVTDLDWWRQLAQTATEYKIGIMPWVGKGMAGRDDWPDGERLTPEWEAWISMLAEQPSLYGFYAWEEPNVFRQLYGEPTDESMLEQYQVLKRLAPKAKVTGTIGLAEPQYAMNYPQTMDVVFPEWFVSPSQGTEYWTSQYNRLWKPMLDQFKGEVYPFILPSVIEKMSIEEILAGWVALQGPVTGLCYYGGLSNILQQVTAYNALLIPKEVIAPKTIIHSCAATIRYNISSWGENNDPLSCPHCGLALEDEGIKGSEEIIDVPEVITPVIVTCSKCSSKLELSVSSLANKNVQQLCPVCGEPAD